MSFLCLESFGFVYFTTPAKAICDCAPLPTRTSRLACQTIQYWKARTSLLKAWFVQNAKVTDVTYLSWLFHALMILVWYPSLLQLKSSVTTNFCPNARADLEENQKNIDKLGRRFWENGVSRMQYYKTLPNRIEYPMLRWSGLLLKHVLVLI